MVTPVPAAHLGAVDVTLEWRMPVPAAGVWSTLFAAPDKRRPASRRAFEGATFTLDKRLAGALTTCYGGPAPPLVGHVPYAVKT